MLLSPLKMVSNYGNDGTTTKLLDGLDWYILPVFNVDGYIYAWTKVCIIYIL